jgi:hypothetical protein
MRVAVEPVTASTVSREWCRDASSGSTPRGCSPRLPTPSPALQRCWHRSSSTADRSSSLAWQSIGGSCTRRETQHLLGCTCCLVNADASTVSAWQQCPRRDRALPNPNHGISPPEWMPFSLTDPPTASRSPRCRDDGPPQTPPSPNITKRSQGKVKERSKGALRELDLEER